MRFRSLISTAILGSLLCAPALAQDGKRTRERRASSIPPAPSGRPDAMMPGTRREVRYEATSESPEVGDISDIKEMTLVYVFSEDPKARQMMLDELKAYPRLSVVSSLDEAEFVMHYTFRRVTSTASSGAGVASTKTTADNRALVVTTTGRLDEERLLAHQRTVWSAKEGRSNTMAPNPARMFVKAFIKDFKRARGED